MTSLMNALKRAVPAAGWLSDYDRSDLPGDLSAGLTVGVMLIPQGMAYAMIAGLPPVYGLYASLVPIVVYGLFGSSRQLAVGPVAMVSLLVATGAAGFAEPGSAEYIGIAITMAFLVGAIQLGMGLFRLGFLVNFLSHPVVSGFTSAAALIIGLSQLKHLLGVDLPRSSHIHEILWDAAGKLGAVHGPTLALGAASIALLLLLRRWKKTFPGPLAVVVLTTGAVALLDLHEAGVAIVGEVPSGLPGFVIPELGLERIQSLAPTVLAIALVGFTESIAVAKSVAARHRYRVDPNQELVGLGLANVVGALFQSYPTTGGFSRTAVNDQAGANTPLASLISAGLIAGTVLLLTPLFYYLPNAVLAAIIMVAVFGLIDVEEARFLWRVRRSDFALLVSTFLGTLFLGIELGIGLGVVLSLAWVIYRSSRPHTAVLGRVPDTDIYRNVDRYPEVIRREGTVIVRIDASLYFANVPHLRDTLEGLGQVANGRLRRVVLDASSINHVDASAVHALREISEEFDRKGIVFRIAGVNGPVYDVLQRADLDHLVGREDERYLSIEEALAHTDDRLEEPDEELVE